MQESPKLAYIEVVGPSSLGQPLRARKHQPNEQLRRLVRQGAGGSQQYPVVLYPTSTGLAREPSKRDFVIDSLKAYRRQVAGGLVPSLDAHLQRGRAQTKNPRQLGLSRLTDLSRSEVVRQELGLSARLNKSYQQGDEVSMRRSASRELSLDFGQADGSHVDFVSHVTTLDRHSGTADPGDPHNRARSGEDSAAGRSRRGGRNGVPARGIAHKEDLKEAANRESLQTHVQNWKVKSILRENHPELTLKPNQGEYSSISRNMRLNPSDPQLPELIRQKVKLSLTGTRTERERSQDEEDLDRKIFYYRFDRNLSLLENRGKILGELASQVQSNPRVLLTSLLIPDKVKRRLRAQVQPPTASDTERRPPQTGTKTTGLTDSERELLRRAQLPIREYKRRPRPLSGDVSEIPVVFEVAGVESKEQEEAKYEAARRQDQQVVARQKQISDKLDAINHQVEEVFMIHNNNKKVSVNGVITITLIDYLADALKQAEKLRELESTMIGLYNNLQDISFFRMFRMSEACHIFSCCRMAQYPKGTKLKVTNKSNLMIILRGRVSVNDPGPVLYDDEGKIILESYKISSVKDGVYENICFTLTDGDYLTSNVFKFMNRKVVANIRSCPNFWSFCRVHGRHNFIVS